MVLLTLLFLIVPTCEIKVAQTDDGRVWTHITRKDARGHAFVVAEAGEHVERAHRECKKFLKAQGPTKHPKK